METKTEGTTVKAQSAVAERLASLGFTKAAERVTALREQKRKLAIACEHYRVVRPEHIVKFQLKLREKSINWDGIGGYHKLDFAPVGAYEGAPPAEVLEAAEVALGRNCFDSMEVAYIAKVRDPLLFGRINGSPLRFIEQWDDDVSISDLLGKNEG